MQSDVLNDTGQVKHTMQMINMAEVEERMMSRRQYLHETCHRLGLDMPGNDSLHKPNPWEFLVNRQFKIVWCNVFKVASSSWMYNFNIMAGYVIFLFFCITGSKDQKKLTKTI